MWKARPFLYFRIYNYLKILYYLFLLLSIKSFYVFHHLLCNFGLFSINLSHYKMSLYILMCDEVV